MTYILGSSTFVHLLPIKSIFFSSQALDFKIKFYQAEKLNSRQLLLKSNEITFEEVLMNLYLNPAYEDALKEKYPGFLQILAPLNENPNKYPSEIEVYTDDNETPIYWAATNGHLEIIKILAPIIKNPNSNGFSRDGTPIDAATSQGFIEVIKFLATFICTHG